MNKKEKLKKIVGDKEVYYPNPDDWNNNFWKRYYLVEMVEGIFNSSFAVNADCEQDAIDYVIDYCEEHLPGLIMSIEEEEGEEFIEDYVCGGNHDKYLNVQNINISIQEL